MILKATNSEMDNILFRIYQIMGSNIPLPVSIFNKLLKNKAALIHGLRPYVEEVEKIIYEYSNGSGIIRKEDDPEKFEKARNEIENISCKQAEIDIESISLSEFGDTKLPFSFISAFSFMLEDY